MYSISACQHELDKHCPTAHTKSSNRASNQTVRRSLLGSLSVGDRDERTGSVPHADKGEAAMFLPLRRECTLRPLQPSRVTLVIASAEITSCTEASNSAKKMVAPSKKNASSNLFCDKFNEAKYIFLVLKFISALCTLNNHTDISTF